MPELDYDEVDRLIRNCKTYNFGMWAADKLAHEVAPALLDRVRKLEAEEHRAMRIATALAQAHTFTTVSALSIANAALALAASPDGAEAERDAALSTIAKVEALHRRHPSYTDTPVCEHCKEIALGATIHAYWPCPTIRALGSVPSTGEGNDGDV